MVHSSPYNKDFLELVGAVVETSRQSSVSVECLYGRQAKYEWRRASHSVMEELWQEQKATLVKKVKLRKFEFESVETDTAQQNYNETMAASIEKTATLLKKGEDTTQTKEALGLPEGLKQLND